MKRLIFVFLFLVMNVCFFSAGTMMATSERFESQQELLQYWKDERILLLVVGRTDLGEGYLTSFNSKTGFCVVRYLKHVDGDLKESYYVVCHFTNLIEVTQAWFLQYKGLSLPKH